MEKTYKNIQELKKECDEPYEFIAMYIATKIFESNECTVYADTESIPKDVGSNENKLVTIILRNPETKEHSRIYLWIGTRKDARAANCSLDGFGGGNCVMIQTVLPHDHELFNKYEIIEDSNEEYQGIEINKVLYASSTKTPKSDEITNVIQCGTERFITKLMETNVDDIIALYVTKRTLRRGDSTLFEETDILIGELDVIRSLGEKEDSESISSDSDYEDAEVHESEESDEESEESDEESEGTEGTDEESSSSS